MIIVVTRATKSPGKRSEAEDLLKRMISYRKKQPEVEESIMMRPLQGNQGRIMTETRFASLAAYEEFRKKSRKDPESQALRKEWLEKQYFVPNTMEQYLHEVVE